MCKKDAPQAPNKGKTITTKLKTQTLGIKIAEITKYF
jgi:hypothetical protein